jgi:hypothetical protein
VAGRYRALLIGNSTYPVDEHNLQTLKGPVKDIAALNRALADPGTGLFDDTDVTLLPEATSARAIRALGRFFGEAARDDVLLFYFSGHGKLDQMARLHLCMQDTETADLLSTAVSSARINEFADASRARNVVIVLDCCYSGAFRGGEFGDAVAGPGRYVLTSCRGTQLANDATADNSTSHFTQHLVDGLLGAAVDHDGDGYLTFSDLYAYVDRRLRDAGRQIPQRRVDGDGDLPLARNPQPDSAPATATESEAAQTPVPPRSAGPRRKILIASLATVLAGAAVAAGLLTRGATGNGSSGGTGHATTSAAFSATAPWRLNVDGTHASVSGGCSLSLIDARSGARIRHLADGIYGYSMFQISDSGSFRWQSNDPSCNVWWQPGTGRVQSLPLTVDEYDFGDSVVFRAPASVIVRVTNWGGNSSCDFSLYAPASGRELDHKTATKGQQDTVTLDPIGSKLAYLELAYCQVLVSAGQ